MLASEKEAIKLEHWPEYPDRRKLIDRFRGMG